LGEAKRENSRSTFVLPQCRQAAGGALWMLSTSRALRFLQS
jgi:hypothetical protein